MKNRIIMLAALVLCLTFFVSVGLAEKDKESPPAKAAPIGEKLKAVDRNTQPTEKDASASSGKKDPAAMQIKPTGPQLTPAQPTSIISPAGVKQPVIQPAPAPVIWERGTQINWQVLSAGGTKGSSSNYQIAGTTVQTAVGYGSSASYQLNQGYWQALGGEGILVGDANGDGVIDVGDVVSLINYLYKHGPAPNPLAAGDTNCDGNVDVGDIVYLINYLFKHGPVPSC